MGLHVSGGALSGTGCKRGSAKWGCTSLAQAGRTCRYTEHGAADGGRDGHEQRIYCMDRRARERKGTDNRSKGTDNRNKVKDSTRCRFIGSALGRRRERRAHMRRRAPSVL